MKRQAKTMGIILICLVLLAAAGLALSLTSPQTESDGEEGSVIWQQEETELTRMEVDNESGGYAITFSDGSAEVEGLDDLPVISSAVSAAVSAAVNLEAEQTLEEGNDRREDFGLDNPSCRVTLTKRDGSTEELALGDPVPGSEEEDRYVLHADEVSVLSGNAAAVFLYGREDFVSLAVTPSADSSSESLLVEEAVFSGSGYERGLDLACLDRSDLVGVTFSTYELTAPLSYPADTSEAESFLTSLFNLTGVTVSALFPDEETLDTCGLLDPWARVEVTYEDADGAEQSFTLLTSEPDENNLAYCMREGRDVIYLCEMSESTWTQMSWEDLLDRQILAPGLRTLDSLTLQWAGEETGCFTFVYEDEDHSSYRIYREDTEVDAESFKNFYYTLISQTADELVLDDLPDTSGMEWLATVTYGYADESLPEDVVSFWQETDRQVYAQVNEERGCRLASSKLSQVEAAFLALVSGETVEARY